MSECTCFDDEAPIGTPNRYRRIDHGRQCWHVKSGVYAAQVGYISDGRTSVTLTEDDEVVLSCPGEPSLRAAITWLVNEVNDPARRWPEDLRQAMERSPLAVDEVAVGTAPAPSDLATSLFG